MKYDVDKKDKTVIFRPESDYDIFNLGKVFGYFGHSLKVVNGKIDNVSVTIPVLWGMALREADKPEKMK